MQEVWFDLEDGTTVDPNDCATDDAGVLRHKNGTAVKMRAPGVPASRGVDVDQAKKPEAKPAHAPAPVKATTEMKPAPKPAAVKKPGYKTRGAK